MRKIERKLREEEKRIDIREIVKDSIRKEKELRNIFNLGKDRRKKEENEFRMGGKRIDERMRVGDEKWSDEEGRDIEIGRNKKLRKGNEGEIDKVVKDLKEMK